MTEDEAYEGRSRPTSDADDPSPDPADGPGPIRALGPEDYPRVLELWRAAGLHTLRPEGRDSPRAIEAQLRSHRLTLLGLEEQGQLIGVVMITNDGRKGWINRLAVRPDHRRRGMGRILIRAAEEHLAGQGLSVIGALIERDNDPSLALFQEAGYRVGDHVVYLSKREDDRA